jgi:undecaprenyl-diphosphatase
VDAEPPGRAGLFWTAALLAAFGVLAGLVAARSPGLLGLDRAAEAGIHPIVLSTPALLASAVAVTDAGGPLSVEVITAGAAIGLLITRRFVASAYLVVARLVEVGVLTAVKHLVGRPRPALPHPVAHASSFSYPSGHTGGTTVLCVSLLVLGLPAVRSAARRLALVALGVLAILAVAASRVLLGVHYPSDVVGGMLLGTACALGLAPGYWRAWACRYSRASSTTVR